MLQIKEHYPHITLPSKLEYPSIPSKDVNDFLRAYIPYNDAPVISLGDAYGMGLRGLPFYFEGAVAPFTSTCADIWQPPPVIENFVNGFIDTFLGSEYAALHLRRSDFSRTYRKEDNGRERSSFLPIVTVAYFVIERLRDTGVSVVYLATDASPSEIQLLEKLFLGSGSWRPLVVVRLPEFAKGSEEYSQFPWGHERLFVLFLMAKDGIVFFCLGNDLLTKDQAGAWAAGARCSAGHGRLFVLFLMAKDGIVFFCLGYDPLTKDQARGLLGRVRTAFLYSARKCDLHSGAPLPDATRDNIRKSFASTFRSHRGKIEEGAQPPPLTIYHDAPFAYRTKSEDSFPAGESQDGEESEEGEEVEEGGWDDYEDDGDYSEGDGGGGGGEDRAELRGEDEAGDPENCDNRRSSADGEAEGMPAAGTGTGTGSRSSRSNGQDQQTREQQQAAGGSDAGGRNSRDGKDGRDNDDDDDDSGWIDGATLVTGQALKGATWQRLPASDPGIGRGRGRRKGGGTGRNSCEGSGGRGSAGSRLTPRQRLLQEVGEVLVGVGADVSGCAVDPCFDLGQPIRPVGPSLDLGQPVRPADRNSRSAKANAVDSSRDGSGGEGGGAELQSRPTAVEPSPVAPARPSPGYPPRGTSTPPIAPSFGSPAALRGSGSGKRLSINERPTAGIAGSDGSGWNMSVTLPPQALAQLAAAMQEGDDEDGGKGALREGHGGEGDGNGGGEDGGGPGLGFEWRSVSAAVAAAQRGDRAFVHSHSWNVRSSGLDEGEEGERGEGGRGGEGWEAVQGRRTMSSQGRKGAVSGVSPGMSPSGSITPSRLSRLGSSASPSAATAAVSSHAFPDMDGSYSHASRSNSYSHTPVDGPHRSSPLRDSNLPPRSSPLARELADLEKEAGSVQSVPVISSSSPGRVAFPDLAPAGNRRSSLAQEIEELEGTCTGAEHNVNSSSTAFGPTGRIAGGNPSAGGYSPGYPRGDSGRSGSASSSRRFLGAGSAGDIATAGSGRDIATGVATGVATGGATGGDTGGDIAVFGASQKWTLPPSSSSEWKPGPGSDSCVPMAGSDGYRVTDRFGASTSIVSEPSASPQSPASSVAVPVLRRTYTDCDRHAAAGGLGGGAEVAAAGGAAGSGVADSTYLASPGGSMHLASPARSCASSIDGRSEVMLRSPQYGRAGAAGVGAKGGATGAVSPARAAVGQTNSPATAFAPSSPAPDRTSRPAFPDYQSSPSASPISTTSPSRSQVPPVPPSSKPRRTSKVFKAFGPKSPLNTVKSGGFWPVQSGWGGGDASPASSTASGFSAATPTAAAAVAAAAAAAASAAAGSSTPVAAGSGGLMSSSSSGSNQKGGEGSLGKMWLKLFGKGWGKGGGGQGGGSEEMEEEEGAGRRGRRLSLQGSGSEAGAGRGDETAGQIRGRLRRNSLSTRLEKVGLRASATVGSNPWGGKGDGGSEGDGANERGREGEAWQILKEEGRMDGREDDRKEARKHGGREQAGGSGAQGGGEDEGEGFWKGKLKVLGGGKAKGRASCSV
ncbi:unnamed protein product [Closterium sp. NIES-65]|nr:unnamed protein product [Closterium sp. NIES-65]